MSQKQKDRHLFVDNSGLKAVVVNTPTEEGKGVKSAVGFIKHPRELVNVLSQTNGQRNILALLLLEKMSSSFVSQIVGNSITGQQTAHQIRQALFCGQEQQVDMVVEQGPGIAQCLGFTQQQTKAVDKISTIFIILKDVRLCDTSNNDVLKQTGDIDAGLTGHEEKMAKIYPFVKNVP